MMSMQTITDKAMDIREIKVWVDLVMPVLIALIGMMKSSTREEAWWWIILEVWMLVGTVPVWEEVSIETINFKYPKIKEIKF